MIALLAAVLLTLGSVPEEGHSAGVQFGHPAGNDPFASSWTADPDVEVNEIGYAVVESAEYQRTWSAYVPVADGTDVEALFVVLLGDGVMFASLRIQATNLSDPGAVPVTLFLQPDIGWSGWIVDETLPLDSTTGGYFPVGSLVVLDVQVKITDGAVGEVRVAPAGGPTGS